MLSTSVIDRTTKEGPLLFVDFVHYVNVRGYIFIKFSFGTKRPQSVTVIVTFLWFEGQTINLSTQNFDNKRDF